MAQAARLADALVGARIGVDVGGTKAEGVLLGPAGDVEARRVVPIHRGEAGVVSVVTALAVELAALAGRDLASLSGIGLGLPGQVDRAAGIVRNAYNIGILEHAIGPALAAQTGLEVVVENDVTAASVGAARVLGLGGTVAYLNLGTGLAAGIVLDGAPLRGSHGFAGEIGHLAVDPRGRPCQCGQHGCLETVASGSALIRFWPGVSEHPGRTLLPAIAAGDAEAKLAFDLLIEGAASAIRTLGFAVDPDAVVVGGGLRMLGAPLFDAIHDLLASWERESGFLAALELTDRISVLPEDSPVAAVGAAWLVDAPA